MTEDGGGAAPARQAARGAVGGAADEAGAAHRAAAAIHMIVAGLVDEPVPEALPWALRPSQGCGPGQVPVTVRLETDLPTDDIAVDLAGGGLVLIQAKLSAGQPELRDVFADQWLPAVLAPDWRDGTALVLAVESPTAAVRALGAALDRQCDPLAGAPSAADRDALALWETCLCPLLDGLPDEPAARARGRLEAAAAVWVLQGRGPASNGRSLARARLADAVVPAGQASSAVARLDEAARAAAQRRSGGTMRDWAAVLADGTLDLVDRPSGVTASRLASGRRALAAHRQSLAQRLNVLALHDLGLVAPEVVVPGLAAGVTVRSEDEPEPLAGGRSLLDEIRGTDRAVLAGPGGAGKSQALIQLAAFAADPAAARAADPTLEDYWADLGDWAPLPVLVPMTALLPGNPREPVVINADRLAAAAVARLDGSVRDTAAAEVADALRQGAALLLLDGLDECRDRRGAALAALEQALPGLRGPVAVVLSARPAAAAEAAAQLGMRTLTLLPPSSLSDAADAVLSALAPPDGEASERAAWLAGRTAWLDRQQDGHREFFSLPLMAVLSALVAGSAPDDGLLPRGRARLVTAVVDLYVDRWESRRGADGLDIPTLDSASAQAAMRASYRVLSHAVSETGSVQREQALRAVAQDVLLGTYTALPGPADQAANQILWAWRESGIFTVSPDGTVRPGLRLFAEVGEALHAVARPGDLPGWAVARAADPDRHAELLLAAELSADVAEALADQLPDAADEGPAALADLAELVAEAVAARAGADPEEPVAGEPAAVGRLRDAAVAALAASTTEGTAWTDQADDGTRLRRWALWRLAELIIDAGGGSAGPAARTVRDALPPRLAALAAASAWARDLYGDRVHNDACPASLAGTNQSVPDAAMTAFTELLDGEPTVLPHDPRHDNWSRLLRREGHQGAVLRAAAAVLPGRPELAERVNEYRHRGDQDHARLLETLLEQHGHGAVLARERAQEHEQAQKLRRHLSGRDDLTWLERLAASAPHASLSDTQRWRLSEIAALAELHDLAGLSVGEQDDALRRFPREHDVLDRTAVRLLGADPCTVAAQAAQLLEGGAPDARRYRAMHTLYVATAAREPDWDRSEDPEADRDLLVGVVRTGAEMLAASACRLLAAHPDPLGTAGLLAAALPALPGPAAHRVALYAGHLGGDVVRTALAGDPAPLVRAAAGRLLAFDRPAPDMAAFGPFAGDPDATVRALSFALAEPAPPAAASLKAVWQDAEPPSQATCVHCGSSSAPAASCARCGRSLPEPSRWVAGSAGPDSPPRRRRGPLRRWG